MTLTLLDLATFKRQQAWAAVRQAPKHLLGGLGLLPPPKVRHAAAHWRGGVTYVHAEAKVAPSGVRVHTPPVSRFEAGSSATEIGVAVVASLAAYREWVRYPNLRSEAAQARFHTFLRHLDAKTNAEMMKGGKLVSISRDDQTVRFKPWRNLGARRGFEGMPPEIDIELPVDAGLAEVGEALAEAFARCG